MRVAIMMRCFERYERNLDAFSRREVEAVHDKKVCVVGCGGLGGYVCMALARFGVLNLTVIDGDRFSKSNLNRQLFATEKTVGQPKALVCKKQLADVNSTVTVHAVPHMLTADNAEELLAGHDLAVDCLDNAASRRVLDGACRALGIPYIHGAIGGFYGQVACVFPGDDTLARIYPPDGGGPGVEHRLGSPVFAPQVISAIQCSEALKLLTGKGELLRGALLHIDLLYNDFEIIRFS